MSLKFRLTLCAVLFLLALTSVACGYPTPDRTTGLTPFVVVVTPTGGAGATTTQAATTSAATTTPTVTTPPATTEVATTTPARTTAQPTKTTSASGSDNTYVVKEGDTLLAIANKLDVDYKEFLKLNNIDDPSKLQIGQVLKIPAKKSSTPTTKP